jgi:hypothetical protein
MVWYIISPMVLIAWFVGCGENPVEPPTPVEQFQAAATPGGNGQGATFYSSGFSGVMFGTAPNRPGAIVNDMCRAGVPYPEEVDGFLLELPDGSYALQKGVDTDVLVTVFYSIGTEWEEWVGEGRLQYIDAGNALIINITGVVAYGGQTRRAVCRYRTNANGRFKVTISLL